MVGLMSRARPARGGQRGPTCAGQKNYMVGLSAERARQKIGRALEPSLVVTVDQTAYEFFWYRPMSVHNRLIPVRSARVKPSIPP